MGDASRISCLIGQPPAFRGGHRFIIHVSIQTTIERRRPKATTT